MTDLANSSQKSAPSHSLRTVSLHSKSCMLAYVFESVFSVRAQASAHKTQLTASKRLTPAMMRKIIFLALA